MKFKFQEHFAAKSKTKSQISKWGKILPFFSLTRHLTEQDLWDTTMVNMRTWCGEKVEAIFKNGDSDPLQFLHKLLQGIKLQLLCLLSILLKFPWEWEEDMGTLWTDMQIQLFRNLFGAKND